MRDLTDRELVTLCHQAQCLFCKSRRLMDGPQGGMMTNVLCDGCEAMYNLPPANILIGGQLLNEPTKDESEWPEAEKPIRIKQRRWWHRLLHRKSGEVDAPPII